MIPRRGHKGHTLAGTLVGLVLVMLLWTALYRHTTGFLRMEKACRLRMDRGAGSTRAMAWGLSLLETGEPPTGQTHSYLLTVADGSEGKYVLIVDKIDSHEYTISVRPATEADASLPAPPETYNK